VPGIERWIASERGAAGEVARAKGGRTKAEYVCKLDAHPKLRRAHLRMAMPE
jgi:hypothetical protein